MTRAQFIKNKNVNVPIDARLAGATIKRKESEQLVMDFRTIEVASYTPGGHVVNLENDFSYIAEAKVWRAYIEGGLPDLDQTPSPMWEIAQTGVNKFINRKFLLFKNQVAGLTPAGTVSTPTFTGSAMANHTHPLSGITFDPHSHTFTGTALAGHVHIFTGSALGTHSHTYDKTTSIGNVSGPPVGTSVLAATDTIPTGNPNQAGINPVAGLIADCAPKNHTHNFNRDWIMQHQHAFVTTSTSSSSVSAGTPSGTIDSVSAGTPAGTISSETVTGTGGTIDGASAGTPAGTVSQPTFTGTPIDSLGFEEFDGVFGQSHFVVVCIIGVLIE